ncbi:MAG: EAL domain-containing protein [Actinobacteria bacterium]|nr:EAL domain-containing protein [Actinomycetota bacterium]MCG2803481.1 EAL domain-containing protein [Cellulomonas sp.]
MVATWAGAVCAALYWVLMVTGALPRVLAVGAAATLLAVILPAVAGASVVAGGPRGLTAPRLGAAAVAAFAAGTIWNAAEVMLTGSLPVPSPGDLGFVLFDLLLLGALVVHLHDHLGELRSTARIDLTNSLLAVLAVLSVPLGPVLHRAVDSSLPIGIVMALLYPVMELLLATVLLAVVVALGVRVVAGWGWLVAGLLALVASDVTFALGQLDLDSLAGTAIELGWLLGLAFVTMWVVRLPTAPVGARPAPALRERPEYSEAVASSTAASATVAGLAVLVAGTRIHLSTATLVLAGLTIVAFGVRAQLAFRHLRRSAVLLRLVHTDDLTDLPNRRALYAYAQRRLGQDVARCALLLMDLDRFKEVNDSLGHHMGDRLLIEVGARLRESLPDGAMLARLGGDEFAIMMSADGAGPAVDLAHRVRAALGEPFDLNGTAVDVTMSIGISLFPDHGDDLPSLLRRADIAMYRAKDTSALVHVFAPEVDAAGTERLGRVQEVRAALARGEFVLHYQPKLDLCTGLVDGVEALVRWQHPVDGLKPPAAFLELVEDAGLMSQLTETVLAQALDQVVSWHHDGVELTVAVNLSASSLIDVQMPQRVQSMLGARGLRPDRLLLEITEDLLMADRTQACAILAELQDGGVRIAIDDFGTGYSSLAYLRDLPIDELKIDRSFVMPMTADERAVALVSAAVALAHGLGLVVVAEGVEDEATLSLLAELGCDLAQGYHIARPMPGDQLPGWLRAHDFTPGARVRAAARGHIDPLSRFHRPAG